MLKRIKMQEMDLTGTIPTEFANLPLLEGLNFHSNHLTGKVSIVSCLYQIGLPELTPLLLDSTGTIPAFLSSTLKAMQLQKNNLRGSIPSQLGQYTSMTRLQLAANHLTSTIPSEIGKLVMVGKQLDLASNELVGAIPSELSELTRMKQLALGNNRLSGAIPSQLGLLKQSASLLALANNMLSSSIPSQLGQMGALTQMDLRNNTLTGAIPSELGMLDQLEALFLGDNQLVGTLSPELGTLAMNGSLKDVDLQNNPLLTGTLPSELCQTQLYFSCLPNGLCGCGCNCSNIDILVPTVTIVGANSTL